MNAISEFLFTIFLFLITSVAFLAMTTAISVGSLMALYLLTGVCMLRVAWCSA